MIAALDRGEIRVAEQVDGEWRVNEDVKAAILDYFRIREMETIELGPYEYRDKIPLKRNFEELGVRVVPPATARYGSFLSRGVVLMPSYVNIGAWDRTEHDGRHVGDRRLVRADRRGRTSRRRRRCRRCARARAGAPGDRRGRRLHRLALHPHRGRAHR